MYYNTNNESGLDLRESWTSNAKQDDLILRIFMISPNDSFTPDEIEEACQRCNRDWPITSIRRAINTLTKHGNLTKTDDTHAWKFATQVRTDINDTDILR